MSDFTITERTEPFTLDEVFEFIEDSSLSTLDVCELKSRIVDVIQPEINKAIDEFAERLKSNEFQKYDLDMVFETSRNLSYTECIDAFHEYVDEIAEQLKGGAIDG